MKLYLAAAYQNQMNPGGKIYRRLSENARLAMARCEHYLESYHYIGHKTAREVAALRKDGRRVFLDSGAFSSYTQGVEVNIDAFARFCLENQDIIEQASVLDAIGDEDGTWRNQKYLEDRGVYCLPCYHYGEPEYVLEYYLNNYDHITIGGMVPVSSANLKRWLDRIWPDHILDSAGQPRAKVHGFGLTSPELMARYPWYSVDSSSWIQVSSFGAVFVPGWGMIHVSDKAPNRKQIDHHFETLAPPLKKKMLETFEYYGFTHEQLSQCYAHRRAFCALTLTLLGEQIDQQRKPVHVTEQKYLL